MTQQQNVLTIILNSFNIKNLKVFILPRVAELFIHKEKKEVVLCLVQIDIHTYILFICLRL